MGKVDLRPVALPLSPADSLLIRPYQGTSLDFPPHVHLETELHYIENAKGVVRIVGDSEEEIDDLELMLVAGGTMHTYSGYKSFPDPFLGVAVYFPVSLFAGLADRKEFKAIQSMLQGAASGLAFGRATILDVQDRLRRLARDSRATSFENLLLLFEILHQLSLDKSARRLDTGKDLRNGPASREVDRCEMVMAYLRANYQRRITLPEVARLINMSEASLMRFMRRWTGKTFVDNLTDIRVTVAAGRLVNTPESVSEICYKCGFNNLSNFNRAFKRRKGLTPSAYRERFARPEARF